MLKLRFIAQTALVATTLWTAAPVLAQQGAGERIDAAQTKLETDIKACKPVDPAEYKSLLDEANRNLRTAEKGKAAGLPVDLDKMKAEQKKASDMYKRALSAPKPCPPPEQQPQPPKQAPAPPKLLPVKPGQAVGEVELDPLAALGLEAWGLFEALDEAIWYCDADEIKKLIPEFEDLLKRARQVADTAKVAGKFSKIKPEDAQKLVDNIQAALDDAKSFKGCPLLLKESTTTPKPSTGTSEKLHQPSKPGGKGKSEKSSLNDLFKPEEKPAPPKHSIVEDIREPPTPGQLRTIDTVVQELRQLTRDFPHLLEGCQTGIWDKHIARLADLAKAARQIADDAKRGYSKGVDHKEAERVAGDAEKAVEEAKRGRAVNEKQWRLPECPKSTVPEPPVPPTPKRTSALPLQLSPFASRILYIHNEARAAVGARPLQWDPQLAVTATAYATEIARTGQLVHAPREGRGIERENLNEAFHGSSPDQLMANWMNEKRNFSAGYFPNVARDGNWMNVAHYTQVIWPTTMFVGCGSARGAQWDFFVCRYSPGGNKDGQPVGYRDPSIFLGGPLDFNPSYSPILKAYRPSNPDRLEFGDEAIAAWKSFELARGRCDLRGMNMSIDALKFDSRGAREHAAEERSKGNDLASQSYGAMAKQIDERVEDATLYRDACARNPYQYQERG